jgi:hypothetical protein
MNAFQRSVPGRILGPIHIGPYAVIFFPLARETAHSSGGMCEAMGNKRVHVLKLAPAGKMISRGRRLKLSSSLVPLSSSIKT